MQHVVFTENNKKTSYSVKKNTIQCNYIFMLDCRVAVLSLALVRLCSTNPSAIPSDNKVSYTLSMAVQ
jgi:hypothetical protein